MSILIKKNALPIDVFGLKTCESCLMDKQARVSFQNLSSKRRTDALDLVHGDACSMNDKTLNGCSYFVTFIDDHSQKVWVYALKMKDQVLDILKQFHISAERVWAKAEVHTDG